MPISTAKISVRETSMEEIALEFNKCASCVKEIITESEKMKSIMQYNYSGRASSGLNDYFTVLNQHLDILQLCYGQLSDYTTMVKEITFMMDSFIGKNFFNNGKGGIK
ncbi:hypothetical protein [Clostridium sp. KNHs205]|jgi:uncharacterized protein YukE|uniref:hypothetical protein n=1 Tax=Clostridium sp. KNHs205 TaxID=1449050 RepID=UPI00051B5050|nr:hypothetical protein [Clostridium sp. KNHs205]